MFVFFPGEHIGCPFATQEESGFEDELPAFSFLSFDPIMVAEQFTLMDAVRTFPFPCSLVNRFSSFLFMFVVCSLWLKSTTGVAVFGFINLFIYITISLKYLENVLVHILQILSYNLVW